MSVAIAFSVLKTKCGLMSDVSAAISARARARSSSPALLLRSLEALQREAVPATRVRDTVAADAVHNHHEQVDRQQVQKARSDAREGDAQQPRADGRGQRAERGQHEQDEQRVRAGPVRGRRLPDPVIERVQQQEIAVGEDEHDHEDPVRTTPGVIGEQAEEEGRDLDHDRQVDASRDDKMVQQLTP
jgi:hypothetical protein